MSVGYNGNTPFIDSNGDMVDVSSLIVTERDGPGYSKVVTKIRTPKVLEVVRTQFGCASMTGMPLEDLPMAGGYSVHWEARLAGPEVILSSTALSGCQPLPKCSFRHSPLCFYCVRAADVIRDGIWRDICVRHDACLPGRHQCVRRHTAFPL